MRTPEAIILSSASATAKTRPSWLGFVLAMAVALCGVGCGDEYRPVALPIPLPSPNPAPAQFVASLSSNGVNVLSPSGTSCIPSGSPPPCLEAPGAMSRIDVSGDSPLNVFPTGLAPAYAAWLPNGTKIYVANSGEDTISAGSGSATAATTITLPQLCNSSGCSASVPVFLNTTEAGKMYVANSGNGTVAVIDTTSDVVMAEVAVDPAFSGSPLPSPNPAADPIALAELPNSQKVYSVNRGNGTVSSISTVDDTVLATIPTAAAPIWAVASSDSRDVYVLDTSGTISVIDTLADAVVATASAGAGANFMFLDTFGNRLYITNPAAATVSVFDVSGPALSPHAGSPVAIAVAPGSACSSALQPTSVTVLADDSNAYVAGFQADPGGSVCTQATVISTGTNAVLASIPLAVGANNPTQTGCDSARFRVSIAATSGVSNTDFKVYISQCDAGSVAVVDTFASNSGTDQHPANVVEATVPAPLSSFPPAQVSISSAAQSSSNTTYTYSLTSGVGLQVGNTVTINGMTDAGNNGSFLIASIPSASTFTVANPGGVTTSSPQTGTGLTVTSQNPVFVTVAP